MIATCGDVGFHIDDDGFTDVCRCGASLVEKKEVVKLFTTETKITGEWVKGKITLLRRMYDAHGVYLETDHLSKVLISKDLRAMAAELIRTADKIDELNGVVQR